MPHTFAWPHFHTPTWNSQIGIALECYNYYVLQKQEINREM